MIQPQVSQQTIGTQAYYDTVNRFWYGSPTNGYVISYYRQGTGYGSPNRTPYVTQKGSLWAYCHTMNVIYGYWKITGSTDASSRIIAQLAWMKNYFTSSDLTTCGVGSSNTASDDTAWVLGFYLQAYEVTGDATILSDAKSLLDAAWSRWYDSTLGGGIWYDDGKTSKSSYQAVYALDNLWYYQLSGDSTYLTRAQTLDGWIAANLQRSGQTVNGQVYPNDGLYWVTMNSNGTIASIGNPYNITPGSSCVLLAGDMAMCVLCARLYSLTSNATYLTRLNNTAVGIARYQTSNGSAISCRDARTDGWASVLYAREVVPLLTASNAFGASGLKTTAQSVHADARSNDMTYGGSWVGPNNGADSWSLSGMLSQQCEVSANAAIWAVAAMAV